MATSRFSDNRCWTNIGSRYMLPGPGVRRPVGYGREKQNDLPLAKCRPPVRFGAVSFCFPLRCGSPRSVGTLQEVGI